VPQLSGANAMPGGETAVFPKKLRCVPLQFDEMHAFLTPLTILTRARVCPVQCVDGILRVAREGKRIRSALVFPMSHPEPRGGDTRARWHPTSKALPREREAKLRHDNAEGRQAAQPDFNGCWVRGGLALEVRRMRRGG